MIENNEIVYDAFLSWIGTGYEENNLDEIFSWIKDKNEKLEVNIFKTKLNNDGFWFYDDNLGIIRNKNNSFFHIRGIERNNEINKYQQPIIVQSEIGFLGIICKKINGVLHFLMQAKIEPGNINKIQISPTIQATKSNFTQKHGGNKPAYLEYFLNVQADHIIVDQIQSEQSSKFYKKRNRNIVILVEDDIQVLDSHKWMTLNQIKKLMRYDNIVNMDTRTVISCLPFSEINIENKIWLNKNFNIMLLNSIFNNDKNMLPMIFNKINNYKMFAEDSVKLIRLDELNDWVISNQEIVCKKNSSFKVIFCDISIEGREVKKWEQPLFEAIGQAVFGLLVTYRNNKIEFLVKLRSEIGCFDKVELGPTIQKEANDNTINNEIERVFFNKLNNLDNIWFDTMLSEEGGRFYHEENRNIIIWIDEKEVYELPDNYIWIDYKHICKMIQFNNVVNIQLRNLISVL